VKDGRRGKVRQGILRFVIKAAEREDVTARAGLALVLETMKAIGLDEVARCELPQPKRRSEYLPEEKLEALVMLVASGGDRVEDIEVLREDKGLSTLLERQLPSSDTLLDFLGAFHDPKCWEDRPSDKKAFVPKESAGLVGLATINRALVARGADKQATTATIDHDGTIIESHRRTATVAYEGTRGYQPLVAVWAEEQLIVADEFRDGNVAGGEDPLSSAKRAFASLPEWVTRRCFRADSAAYYQPLLKYLVDEKIAFAISADMSQQLRGHCEAVPPTGWTLLETRTREDVHLTEVEFVSGNWPKTATPLRYVAIRFTPLQRQLFEQQDETNKDSQGPRYHAIVTNRPLPVKGQAIPVDAMSAPQLVQWHREKAGTIEHVHRTMKDELGAGVMPSPRFQVNAAWFRINALAFNIMTVLKRRALPARYREARPKRLRFDLLTLPAKLAVHQGSLAASVSASESRIQEIVEARQKLLALYDARAGSSAQPQ
jgi:hypothetical protein